VRQGCVDRRARLESHKAQDSQLIWIGILVDLGQPAPTTPWHRRSPAKLCKRKPSLLRNYSAKRAALHPRQKKLPRRRRVRPRAAARCGLACCALPRLDRLTGCSAAAMRAWQCRWRTSPCATSCAGSHGTATATSSMGTHTPRPCPHRQPRAESRPGGQRVRLCAREHRWCWCASKHLPCALWGAGAGLRAG